MVAVITEFSWRLNPAPAGISPDGTCAEGGQQAPEENPTMNRGAYRVARELDVL